MRPPWDEYPSVHPLVIDIREGRHPSPISPPQAPPRKRLAAAGQLPIRPPAQGPPAEGPPASAQPAGASSTAQALGRRRTTTHPPTRSRSANRGTTSLPHPSCAISTSRTPAAAWTATSPRGPHGAKPHRLFLPPDRARYGPHLLVCQPPCPADAAPCGSAVLAPSCGEAFAVCQPPAPQTGSAQAARQTATHPRSIISSSSSRPSNLQGRGGRPGACGQTAGSVPPRTPTPSSTPARPFDVFAFASRRVPPDAAPCGSAVLAPSCGEAFAVCQPPAPQTGSAQAARQTAPARARSSPRRRQSLPSCKAGVAALEPAAKQPASVPPGTPTPIPHPPALLMSLRLPAAVPRRCSSVRLRRTRSIGR